MASVVLLSDMITQARQRADMVNSNFVSDSELTGYLNEANLELYDLLTTKFADEYFHTYDLITIGSASNIYALPKDFYKLKGVEIASDASNNRFITIVPYMFNERNRYAYNNSNLPTRSVRVRYIPRAKRLSSTAQTFVDGDVTVAADTITETDHQLSTGEEVTFTTTGVLPTGLSTGTTYYVVRVDNDTFSVASSLQNAFVATVVSITAAAGGGTHTIVGKVDRADYQNGYEAYVIWRAVEMMKEKEESETTVAQNHVARQVDRINIASGNRDAAFPQRIVDANDINDFELRQFQETNIRYRVVGNNIEFLYIGYLGL